MPPIHPLKSGLRVLAATSALVVFAGSAYAVDGNAVAARLKAVYAEQGGTIEYGSVETNGSTVILKDTKVSTDRDKGKLQRRRYNIERCQRCFWRRLQDRVVDDARYRFQLRKANRTTR